jgi:hypothetical protein
MLDGDNMGKEEVERVRRRGGANTRTTEWIWSLADTYFSAFVVSLSLYLKYTAAPTAIRATVAMIITKPVMG